MGIRSTVMAPHGGTRETHLPTVAVALAARLSSLSAAPSAITMGKKGKLLDYSLLPSLLSSQSPHLTFTRFFAPPSPARPLSRSRLSVRPSVRPPDRLGLCVLSFATRMEKWES